jgi:hypothetical protein
MSVARKNTAKKALKKRTSSSTVVVVRTRISAKDTLFPEKVAKAKRILSNTQDL